MLLRRSLSLVGSASLAPSGARLLRTGRRGSQRLSRSPSSSSSDAPSRSPPKAPPKPPSLPLVALPPLTRVRDLAKALQQPLDSVLPRVASRAHRKLHMRVDGARFEFASVRQVAVPFALAQRVAAHFGRRAALDVVEPTFTPLPARVVPSSALVRAPVVAVMGHVDHGKTTLLDALRGSNVAQREAHGITQKIHACDARLSAQLRATFLDTPGHFHFFRMRSSAAQLADLVVLVVAADEGCLLQTEEAIGAIEDAQLPVVACVNKVDVATPEQIEQVKRELREYVALQNCPIVEISATEQLNLEALKATIAELLEAPAAARERVVDVSPGTPAEGVVLESVAARGRGTVLRVLLRNGVLNKHDHFVAGMIHGAVRSLRNTDGEEISRALPGAVVDVIYANKSKNVDAPNEFGFFVLPEARAKQVIEQRCVLVGALLVCVWGCALADARGSAGRWRSTTRRT